MNLLLKFQWGPLIVGALTCLLIQMGLVLLGGGIGLSIFDWENGAGLKQLPWAGALVALALSVALSFFAGGYLASYWARIENKTSAVLHGVAVWAL